MAIPRDEALIGTDALQTFMEEWGDMTILYNRIVLEEVLKELFGIEENENGDENS